MEDPLTNILQQALTQSAAVMGNGGPSHGKGKGGIGFPSVGIPPQHYQNPEDAKCKMFIGGIATTVSDDKLRSYFSQFGEVIQCNVMTDQYTGNSRGFGFITFSTESSVDAVLNQTIHYLDDKMMDCKRAVPKGGENQSNLAGRKVFVGGLPPACDKQRFIDFASQFGKILEASVNYTKDGIPRGFGYITFEDQASVDRAVGETGSHYVDGKWVDVKRYDDPSKRAQIGGGAPAPSGGGFRTGFFGKGKGGPHPPDPYDVYGYQQQQAPPVYHQPAPQAPIKFQTNVWYLDPTCNKYYFYNPDGSFTYQEEAEAAHAAAAAAAAAQAAAQAQRGGQLAPPPGILTNGFGKSIEGMDSSGGRNSPY